jgi:phage tail-like protein
VATPAQPVGSHNFMVRLLDASQLLLGAIGGLTSKEVSADAGFSECRGLEGTLQVQEYPEGGLNDRVRKFATRMTWGNITLLRGVGLSRELWDWYFSYVRGEGRRRDGLVILLNDRREPVLVWRFTRGFPSKWTGPTLTAQGNQLAIETLEITHEGLEVQAGPGLLGPQ